jgi:hypothetical protein
LSSRFTELVIDCHDPRTLAAFWCRVLDYEVIADTGELVEIAAYEPTIDGVLAAPGPSTLVFIRVPEAKGRKNRLHIDLSPVDGTRDEEVARLVALGASHVDIGQGEQSWVVLADPEGNEFCVLRALTDRMQAPASG